MGGTVVGPGKGEVVPNPVGGDVTFKVRGEETGGTLTVFESVIAPGQGPPLHVHSHEDETLYVLDGDLRFGLGESTHDAPPGTLMFVPRGTRHAFQNIGATPARLLITFTPSGMERFFTDLAVGGRFDPGAFAAAGHEVGMNVVGPPLAR